jgi:DNA helicase IV
VSDEAYENELRAEQSYVSELYTRLDAERARLKNRYAAALRSADGDREGATLLERDVEVRAIAKQQQRLDVADQGLCFGRLDAESGEQLYIGRIGILGEGNDQDSLLLDWRAPAARAFYVATAAHPESMRRRRQFHSHGRRLVDFTDENFGRPGEDTRDSDAALLAAVNAPRGDGMRDIVATIQAEQDGIIRLEHPGVLVIEGGPGTGKTVVALHRVAYLLYTQRARFERHGVLVVGPNQAFLHHIGRVLPSLGESDVVFMTAGDLMPGLTVTAEDGPDAARIKGALTILDVLAAAVADRQQLPDEPLPVEMTDVTVRIDAPTAEWARQEARDSGLPHNDARAKFREIVTYVLTERAVSRIAKGWLSREDTAALEELRSDITAELGNHEQLSAAIDELWPILTPESLLASLYSSRERLRAAGADDALWREDGAAWTVSDVPLLDELVDLLGRDRAADEAAERERQEEAAYAAGVLDLMVDREDLMDDEDHLLARDVIDAEELADRFVERDNRDLSERAASDREWTYRHVVVDEAQELSQMDWRVLMRRCPSRSFTVVGDLAQRRSAAGSTSWDTTMRPYVPGRWVYKRLTVNYRTPAEIMAVAAALLAEIAPGVQPPESVRTSGVPPWSRQVAADELASAIAEFVQDEAGRDGTSVVIGPPGLPGVVPASETKGLEYDAVLVVEPDKILAEGTRGAAELYVALTRATQRLGVLHTGPLPPALAGLTTSTRTPAAPAR